MAEKIEHAELESLAREFIANSLGGPGSEVSATRERNLLAYNALPEGEFAPVEIEDRSTYVSSDVADTVDGMIPQILDVFVSSDNAVECKPTKPGPESATIAKQATGYLNYLFYTRNEGLNILHDWLQDAALQKVGFVKTWAEKQAEDSKQTYEGQTEDQLAAVLDDGAKLQGEPQIDEQGGLTFTVVNESKRTLIKTACVAPHEMRVDANAMWGDEPAAIGEVRPKRRFELEEKGYDLSNIGGEWNPNDAEARAGLGDQRDEHTQELHDSHKLYEYAELYFKLDVDGDGTAEWVQLCLVNGVLLNVEQMDGHPYSYICLMPRAHAFFGDCPADRAYSIQKDQTNLTRSLFDNVTFATNKRTYVNTKAKVNISDLLDNRPGGIVRGEDEPGKAFGEIPVSPIPQTAWQLQEFLSVRLENRTGFTRYSQGMDADSLNKTATGVSIITQKADIRLRLMTRFAAQGVKAMFAKMLELATKHQDREEWFEVNGEWAAARPFEWRDQFNVKINVGLGHGTKEQQAQRVMAMVPLQQMGVQMGVVRPEHVANTIRLFAAVNEFKNPDEFCDPQPTGMPPNPQAFQQMQQQVQGQMQQMDQQLRQLSEENAQLKQQVADKSADIALKGKDLEIKDAELDRKRAETFHEQTRADFQAEHAAGQQFDVAEQVAQLQAQVQGLTEFVSSLFTQPGHEADSAMDGGAALQEQPL